MRNPLTLEAFADWCEKQPANKRYKYMDTGNCAFCQYAKTIGFANPNVGGSGWYPGDDHDWRDFPAGLEYALARTPFTFGALAARLKGYPTS